MRKIHINPVMIPAPCSGTLSSKNSKESCSRAALFGHIPVVTSSHPLGMLEVGEWNQISTLSILPLELVSDQLGTSILFITYSKVL